MCQQKNSKEIIIEFGFGGNWSGLYNAKAPHQFFFNTQDGRVPIFYPSINEAWSYHRYDKNIFSGTIFNLAPQIGFSWPGKNKFKYFTNLSFKKRGIDFKQTNETSYTADYYTQVWDTVHRRINNSYLDLALGIRYYLKGQKIKPYLYAGFYSGLLVKEKTSISSAKTVIKTYGQGGSIQSYSWYRISVDNQKWDKYSGTRKIDYGLIMGGGAEYKMNEIWGVFFRTSVQIGLNKTDKFNNNEYLETKGIGPSPFTTYSSRNYYGFNSKSKYISIEPVVGVSLLLK